TAARTGVTNPIEEIGFDPDTMRGPRRPDDPEPDLLLAPLTHPCPHPPESGKEHPDVPLRSRTRAFRSDLPRPRPADGSDAASAPLKAERGRVRDRDPRRGRDRRWAPPLPDPGRPGSGAGHRVHGPVRHGWLGRGPAGIALRDGGGPRGVLAPTPIEV